MDGISTSRPFRADRPSRPASEAVPEVRPQPPALLYCRADGIIERMTPAAHALLGGGPIQAQSFYSLVSGRNLYRVLHDVSEMVCSDRAEATWLLRLRTTGGRFQWFEALAERRESGGQVELCVTLRGV